MFKSFDLDVTHKIKSDQPIDQSKVLAFLKERLGKIASRAKVDIGTDGTLNFKGIILGSQQVVGLKLQASVVTEGNSAKVRLNGKPYWGPMYWVAAIFFWVSLGLWQYGPSWILLSLLLGISVYQMRKYFDKYPKQFIDKLIKETDTEFS